MPPDHVAKCIWEKVYFFHYFGYSVKIRIYERCNSFHVEVYGIEPIIRYVAFYEILNFSFGILTHIAYCVVVINEIFFFVSRGGVNLEQQCNHITACMGYWNR